jgi:hypothetical protein
MMRLFACVHRLISIISKGFTNGVGDLAAEYLLSVLEALCETMKREYVGWMVQEGGHAHALDLSLFVVGDGKRFESTVQAEMDGALCRVILGFLYFTRVGAWRFLQGVPVDLMSGNALHFLSSYCLF